MLYFVNVYVKPADRAKRAFHYVVNARYNKPHSLFRPFVKRELSHV